MGLRRGRGLARAVCVALFFTIALPAGSSAKKATFDFGDAPDERSAAPGQFPSLKASDGPRYKTPDLKLGREADTERDSMQVNVDVHDDGLQLEHVPCQEVTYRFIVNVKDVPKKRRKGTAFLNLFVDWNLDGDWQDVDDRCGPALADVVPEHRIQNEKVGLRELRKGPVQVVKVKSKAGGTATQTESGALPFWVRGVISDRKMDAPGDSSQPRPGKQGEVEDYGPTMESRGDFGDAPDGLNSQNIGKEPLCKYSSTLGVNRVDHFCAYPARKGRGPLHLNESAIGIGDPNGLGLVFVDDEDDSVQPDADVFDGGFEHPAAGCETGTFLWRVVIQNPKRLDGVEKALAKRLIKQVERGSAKILVNAWLDSGNDGEWSNATRCEGQGKVDGDHYVRDSKLDRDELRDLAVRGPGTGERIVFVKRKIPIGLVPAEGPGCARGTVSVDERYFDVSGGATDASVRSPYLLGETEDVCGNDSGGSGTPIPTPGKCNDGVDNDGDGKIDANDPGCQTGPGGVYDPEDHNEGDQTSDVLCPTATTSQTQTIKMFESGSLVRHLLRLDGAIVVDKGQGEGDFTDGGPTGPIRITCSSGTEVDVTILWTTSGAPENGQTPLIEYRLEVAYVSGPGGGTFNLVAAPNTR